MDLKIDYDELSILSGKINDIAGNFSKILSDIKGTNNNLKTKWTGEDATKYLSAVDEQAKVMDDLKKSIEDISAFLTKVGKAYHEVMEANKKAINI